MTGREKGSKGIDDPLTGEKEKGPKCYNIMTGEKEKGSKRYNNPLTGEKEIGSKVIL